MKTFAWFSFWLVAAVWGSSFLLIRVGVAEFTPAQISFIRCLIAAIGLNAVMLMRGKRYPTDRRVWLHFALVGLGNAALPYWLIGAGEQSIESALASIVQATVPMFSIVIAHYGLSDERINPQKIIGLMLGFGGVVVLALRQSGGIGQENSLLGMLAVVGASLSYALMSVYTRRNLSNRIEPIVIAGSTFIFAAFFALLFVFIEPVLGGRPPQEIFTLPTDAIFAVLMLGVVNTFVAYLFFYYIIRELGAFRATSVTYVIPVFGVTLGWLVLGETIDALLILGAVLILTGIGIINLGHRLRAWLAPRRVVTAP